MANNPFLTLVALQGDVGPNLESVADSLQAAWPELPLLTGLVLHGAVGTARWGDAAVAITHFPRPIPWEYLEGPCDTAWYWPEAAETMQAHRSHLLVHLLDEGPGAVRKSIGLTQLVAASALAAQDAVGILWGPGRLVHPVPAFLELARDMTTDEWPLYLWVDFRVELQDDGQLRLFTTGLEALGQLEIEVADFQGDVGELRANVYNVAHYTLQNKKPINDGQSLGSEGGQRMVAHFEPSLVNPDQEVLRLELVE